MVGKKFGLVLVMLVAVVGIYFGVQKPSLPTFVGGYCNPNFSQVEEIFRANVESGIEKGAAYAVYYKGEPVVDLWAGYADIEAERPWSEDTVTLAFSSTKAVAALVAAKMVDSGVLDYKKPVSAYWPEFAQNGKDNITVEMLLSHQAGLVVIDPPLSLSDIRSDLKKVEDILASQTPVWPPGTKFGYHGISYGLYVDRLIQKADKAGRDTATVFYEDIAEPFDIDFSLNLSRSEMHRAARLYPRTKLGFLLDAIFYPRYLGILKHVFLYPDSLLAKSLNTVKEFSFNTNLLNDPGNRDVTVTSISGTGTARALAKLYGILANGGKIDDQQLLSKDLLGVLSTPVMDGEDEVMQTGEFTEYGPGTIFSVSPMNDTMFGHSGHGGQVVFGDLKNRVSVAYLTNHLSIHGVADDPRYVTLLEATYRSLKAQGH